MSTTIALKNMVDYLDENEKLLLLEIVKKFLPDRDVMPYDEYYIGQAELEYANGESPDWADIRWK